MLNKREAIKLLGLDEKTFENYFRIADEFQAQPRENERGNFRFDEKKLAAWAKNRQWRTVSLTREDYARCLDFALAQHFRGYVLSDFGTGRQREFGQKLTNWIKGQLGEIAVQKFFKEKFKIAIDIDFSIQDEIVPQDIIGIKEGGKMRTPRIGVAIKSSKPKNAYLILGANEITIESRRSGIYIFCRPNIPDDHILRLVRKEIINLVKGEQHFSRYKDNFPGFQDIPCEIAGWCEIDELEKVTSIPGQDFDGPRYVKKSGLLHRTEKDWQKLITQL